MTTEAQRKTITTWLDRIPTIVWFAGTGLVFALRFPGNFLLHPPYLMDLDLFQRIAVRLMHGEAAQLYAPVGSAQSLFKYAPGWAVLFAPLGWLSAHQAAAIAWSSLTVVWLIALCWCASRIGQHLGLGARAYLAIPAVLLVVRPLTEEFLQGQTNVLWGLLTTAALFFRLRRREWQSASCLALAISLKLPALLFPCYLALRRDWQALARIALCFLAFNGIAALLLSPGAPLDLFASWLNVLRISGPDRAFEIGNQSLLALLGRLLRHDGYGLNVAALSDGAVFGVALAVQAAGFAALWVPRALRATAVRDALEWALLTVMMVLFSPTCWVATYSALLFPVWLAAALWLAKPRAMVASIPVTAGALGVLALSELTHAAFWRRVGLRYFRGESYVYLVFMILPLFGLTLGWTLWCQRAAWLRDTSRS